MARVVQVWVSGAASCNLVIIKVMASRKMHGDMAAPTQLQPPCTYNCGRNEAASVRRSFSLIVHLSDSLISAAG